MTALTAQQAEALLVDQDVAPCMEGGLREVRELLTRCLEAGIPAVLGTEGCGKGGCCSPKAQLVVRTSDASHVAELLREEWLQSVRSLGVEPITPMTADPTDGELPCPACGTAAPLLDGACADCGLQLE